jgi:hypothetical protein
MVFKFFLVIFLILVSQSGYAQGEDGGLRGDSLAIEEARAMVETMGGMEIWSRLKSIHFVHEWFPWYRIDSYIENETLDLTGPRSRVEMKSEIYERVRAYSPEYKYWSIENGKFLYADQDRLEKALERAPYSIYRLARSIAIGDSELEIRFGRGDIPRSRRLEFYGTDGIMYGWIILNAKKEPIVWATTQYRYIFGPLKKFGNIWVPNWAVYENGITYYEMISLRADNQAPDSSLFMPPPEFLEKSETQIDKE